MFKSLLFKVDHGFVVQNNFKTGLIALKKSVVKTYVLLLTLMKPTYTKR